MQIEGKNIIVTGGQGFIGSTLVNGLIKYKPKKIVIVDNMFIYDQGGFKHGWLMQEPDIETIVGDAGDYPLMESIIRSMGEVDFVFNLAVMPLPHSLEHPIENFNNNVQIVTTLLSFLKTRRIKRLIHFSSSEVYGSCQTSPMDETHPYAPSTPYAASKLAGDQLVLSYAKSYRLPAVIIRPFNNYGPFQNDGSYAGIIPRTIKRLIEGKDVEIFGDGTQTRDYVFVEDTVRAAILIAIHFEEIEGMIFNVASGKEVEIGYLVKKIREIYMSMAPFAEGREIVYCPARPMDVHRHIGSGYLIEDTLGFKPQIDINNGLYNTVQWYIGKVIE
ncbi:MAG: NAD-dependent epimerase/dehydratase family protein [Candidatus Colwellbacteria bacterium]|nr:NAD-dependent epimerase/dehydratase family protein [Candidatus Colwellbacteria bacterium]